MKASGREIKDKEKDSAFSKTVLYTLAVSKKNSLKGKENLNGLKVTSTRDNGKSHRWMAQESLSMLVGEVYRDSLRETITYKTNASLIQWMMKRNRSLI